MPKFIYCSKCGTELDHRPVALKNKATIIHTVDPHVCDEKNLHNITDADKPTPAVVQINLTAAEQQVAEDLPFPPDRRGKDSLRKERTSSAPAGVLQQVKSGGDPFEK